jgi:hypothetical protein
LSALSFLAVVFVARSSAAQEPPPGGAPPAPTTPQAPVPPTTSDVAGQPIAPSASGAAGDAPVVEPLPATTQPLPGPMGGSVGARTPTPPPPDPDVSTATGADLMTGTAGARAAGAAPPGAGGTGFMDTRLTFTFGDDDILHRTGELVPISPRFSIGDRPQYRLFFDNLNSRFAGRENISHLVMYKKLPAFFPNLTTEAALVLRLDLSALSSNTGNLNAAFYDSGSYIRLFYRTGGPDARPDGLSAVFFPLDTDRFRLGYLYDISWGGTAASINQSIFPRLVGSSPGFKVQYDLQDRFYVFGGMKTATIVQPQQVLAPGETEVETVRVGESNYGLLGGFGVDVMKNLRFDGGAGFFQQGRFEFEDVRGRPVYTYGASARAVVHQDMPVPQSIDFLLYRNDPAAPMILFAPPRYNPDEFAWSFSAEATALRQRLKTFEVAGETRDQAAYAGALQAVLAWGYARISATGIVRNLSYVVRNVPGFIPFVTLPTGTQNDPELFGAFSADYYFSKLHLTPGLSAGLQLPATFRSTFSDGGIPAQRTIVVRQQGDESILPYNEGRSPIIQTRASVRWTLNDMLSAVLWAQWVRDNNGTLVVRDPNEGTASLRVFQSPDRLGFGAALQARF